MNKVIKKNIYIQIIKLEEEIIFKNNVILSVLLLETLVFDQKSPVHPVSESRRVTVSLTYTGAEGGQQHNIF